jgi:hypothetical protein
LVVDRIGWESAGYPANGVSGAIAGP